MCLVTCVFWHSVSAAVAFLMAPLHKSTWLRHKIWIPFWFSRFCNTTSSVDALKKKNTDICSILSFQSKVVTTDVNAWIPVTQLQTLNWNCTSTFIHLIAFSLARWHTWRNPTKSLWPLEAILNWCFLMQTLRFLRSPRFLLTHFIFSLTNAIAREVVKGFKTSKSVISGVIPGSAGTSIPWIKHVFELYLWQQLFHLTASKLLLCLSCWLSFYFHP